MGQITCLLNKDDWLDSHKIGSGGKLVMGLMELTGVRKYR